MAILRKRTVVQVLPYMAKGGTEKHVLTLLRGFQNKYRCVLLAPRGEILGEFLKLRVEHVEFPELKGNVLKKMRVFRERLTDVDERYGIDLVHVHAAHEFLSFTRKVLPETPLVFHLSAHQGSAVSRLINYRLSAVLSRKKANLLIAVSEEEKRTIVRSGFPEDKVEVVYNGYERGEGDDGELIGTLKRKYGLENHLVVGNLGRFHKTKRLDLLVRAFSLLKKNSSGPFKLLLVGDGPERARLEKLVCRSGFEKDVVFTGFIPRGDRVLSIFDVFVLPTTFEGCSNVLVEAMAKGLPIVTTDVPSVSWMFTDGEQALLFRNGDAADLADKLKRVANDLSFRKDIGKNAARNFHDRFDARMMIDKIDRIYKALMT